MLKIYELFIEIRSNNINFIVEELLKFKKIQLSLLFKNLNITEIPKNIYNLKNLKYLCLNGKINHIPCKLKKLETLFIRGTAFTKKYPFLLLCDLNLRNVQVTGNYNDYFHLKQIRLIFRLYFLINKKIYVLKKISENYKILEKLIKY